MECLNSNLSFIVCSLSRIPAGYENSSSSASLQTHSGDAARHGYNGVHDAVQAH